MEKIYTDILKRAFLITWNNKFLWFFGVFAAFLTNGGVYDVLIRKFSFLGTGKIPFISHSYWISDLLEFFSWSSMKFMFANSPVAASMLLLVEIIVVVAVIGLIWLVVMSQITLIKSIAEIDKTKPTKAGKKGLVDFRKMKQHFLSVLGVNVLAKLLVLLSLLIIAAFLVYNITGSGIIGSIFYLVCFVLFIIFSLIVSFVTIYATCYIILKKAKFWDSIRQAIKLFYRNWMISIEMAFILFVITFLTGLGLTVVLFLALAPVLLALMISYSLASVIAFNLFFALAVLLLIGLLIFYGAAIVTFQISAWVLLYERIAITNSKSKLERIVEGLSLSVAKKTARRKRKKKITNIKTNIRKRKK